jgi:N-acetylmuramoyl-L-alanine amidase
MKIAISPGHGTKIRGACYASCHGGQPWGLDEVDYCQVIVPIIARFMRDAGAEVIEIVDEKSTTQDANLSWLVQQHNAAFGGDHGDDRLDISVHLNAYQPTTTTPRGVEVWYYSQAELARDVASEISIASGLIDRGGKQSNSLAFLANTESASILIEVGFCDSKPDSDLMRRYQEQIAEAIAAEVVGAPSDQRPPPVEPPEDALFYAKGTCSWFGGPDDDGVSSSEGLAFFYDPDECPHLMLPKQPSNTTGMARRLDADRVFYVACRWDYGTTPKEMLRDQTLKALVRGNNNREFYAFPADWGPHEEQTGRAADLSPALMRALFDTDDATDEIVEVVYPAP